MPRERTAAAACVSACAVTVGLVAIPYLLADPSTAELYYAGAPVGPRFAALFAVLAAIVVAAGAAGRTDRATAAGAALVLGVFVAGAAWWWASSVVPSTAGAVSSLEAFRYHRWAVAIAATAVAATAAWYARSTVGFP